jgi:hypothetical protein
MGLDPKRNYYLFEILLLKWGMRLIPLFICTISLYLFYSDLLNLSLDKNLFYSRRIMLDYAIRFLIFIIPATITIFTFVYKEKKDASYSNLKTSNITQLFICTICIEILALIFSITTFSEFPKEGASSISGFPYHHYQMSILFTLSAIVTMVIYSIILFIQMDIHYSFRFAFNKNVKLHLMLKYFYKNNHEKHKFSYNHMFEVYNYMLESNFQLVIAAISKKNLSNVEDELKKLFALTKDFYSTFIDVSSVSYLSKLIMVKDNHLFFYNVIKFIKYILGETKLQEEPLENRVDYQEKLLEVYKTILYSYKMIIREASKNHVTDIQKLAYIEFSVLNPIKLFKFNPNDLDADTFVNINSYYQKLAESYHEALFETIKEFSDEKTVEYSYLLNQITSSVDFFESVKSLKRKRAKQQDIFYTSLINKETAFVESLIIRAVEINNIRFLTESMRLLLDLFYSHVNKPEGIAKVISNKLRKEHKIFDKYVTLPTNAPAFQRAPDGMFKELVVTNIMKIVLNALYKSIELNNYGCTGYIIKVSVSHITMRNYLKEIKDFIQIIIERQNLVFNLNYYHYSFNSYSKIHCLQKMVLLLTYQFIFKYGDANKQELHDLVKVVFLENKTDLDYMVEKIKSASKSYGMISISPDTEKSISTIIQPVRI